MCSKSRTAKAPFTSSVSQGATWINDADGYSVAAMCAPREDARGLLTVAEQKRWIADNAALFVAAPALVRLIQKEFSR
jgi:hypothetical protein